MDVKRDEEDQADFLPIATVAEILNVSRATGYLLVNSGKIPSFTFGGARRVKRQDLKEFIESSKA